MTGRRAGKAAALPKGDFVGIFKELDGRPATIRFLTHPSTNSCLTTTHRRPFGRKNAYQSREDCSPREELHEFNPMLGFRGCRLGLVYPEISEMQARAVFEAAAEAQGQGIKVKPEIMIPLVGFKRELDLQVELVHRVAKEVMTEKKVS